MVQLPACWYILHASSRDTKLATRSIIPHIAPPSFRRNLPRASPGQLQPACQISTRGRPFLSVGANRNRIKYLETPRACDFLSRRSEVIRSHMAIVGSSYRPSVLGSYRCLESPSSGYCGATVVAGAGRRTRCPVGDLCGGAKMDPTVTLRYE